MRVGEKIILNRWNPYQDGGHERLGWKEADLAGIRKGHPAKVKLAGQLRQQTTVTIKWIAERLQMGHWPHVNHLLYWHQRRIKK